MKAALRLACGPLYHGSFPALLAAGAAAGAAAAEPSPTIPMIESLDRYLSITSGGWIMSNSSVASLPAKVRIANSPPGWSFKKSVTSRTLSWRMTQHEDLLLWVATSSFVIDLPPPAAAAGAAAPPAFAPPPLFMLSSYDPPAILDPDTSPVRPPP